MHHAPHEDGLNENMDRGKRSKNKKICSKRIIPLYVKLVVFIGGLFCLIVKGRKQNKPPPKSVAKIQPDYPLTNRDGSVKPGVTLSSRAPSAPPTKEPPPPPLPKPFLELNSQNPISKDVSRLWHNAEMGAVCLTIPRNADCSHPLLIGRLSGPSLSILEWTSSSDDDDDNEDSTTFCGKYNGGGVIQGAVYFVEILTAYCKDFSVGALSSSAKTSSSSSTSSSPRHTDEWLSFNWTEVCMQNTLTNRLTQDNCAILITNSSSTTLPIDESHQSRNTNETQSQSLPHVPAGFWTRNGKQNLIPLYSRFQPLDCQSNNKKLPRCARPMSSARLDGYDFSWTSEMPQNWKAKNETYHNDLLKKCNCKPSNIDCLDGVCKVKCVNCVQEKTMPTLPITEFSNGKKVCIIGASHSYHLMYSIDMLNMGHLFHWIELQFPVELQEGFFEEQNEKVGCKIFVIGFGQWPASHQSNPPYSFERYLQEMRRIAQLAQDSADPTFQVYLRSMHHMPIGDRASSCPPTDWRTPAVANAYNYLLEQAVQAATATTKSSSLPSSKNKVHFLDSLFITHPMWDVAYDLYHLPRKVADLEALYIASTVLSD